MAKPLLDNLDKKIISLLADNAREPYLEIARVCGVSGAAIHTRMLRLQNAGVVTGSQLMIDAPKAGYDTCAFMGFFLGDPTRYDEVISGLKEIPEVVECHLTTGKYDMFIKLYAHNNEHLLQVLRDKIQPLGIASTETTIILQESFKRSLPVKNDVEDDKNDTKKKSS
ncbi:MAG: Lrp/AsnC ligand binding domain-containing protein, partial [Muribaculaceae bacterium]|nr:Lrp/AsnC ligand binding domain-containing protein [Muribaculaceae bacterium]